MNNEDRKNNQALEKAICFAVDRHRGAVRKATTIPYILHPLEAMLILASVKADTSLLIAGVLHDTVEDTDTTLEEIAEQFGPEVADLVSANSEDKSKSWDERKSHTIQSLQDAPLRIKMLVAADKIANLRSIAADDQMLGNDLWKRFNAPKEKQAWYYYGIKRSLSDLQNIDQTRPLYVELARLYDQIFTDRTPEQG